MNTGSLFQETAPNERYTDWLLFSTPSVRQAVFPLFKSYLQGRDIVSLPFVFAYVFRSPPLASIANLEVIVVRCRGRRRLGWIVSSIL